MHLSQLRSPPATSQCYTRHPNGEYSSVQHQHNLWQPSEEISNVLGVCPFVVNPFRNIEIEGIVFGTLLISPQYEEKTRERTYPCSVRAGHLLLPLEFRTCLPAAVPVEEFEKVEALHIGVQTHPDPLPRVHRNHAVRSVVRVETGNPKVVRTLCVRAVSK